MAEPIRVVVLYGGRSGEHEVSLHSAASVIRHLDRARFTILPVGIDKAGRWRRQDLARLDAGGGAALAIHADAPEVRLAPGPDGRPTLLLVAGEGAGEGEGIDVVFPVMHGPLCEDGAMQGVLELADVAYVGSGVLASAIGMDKDIAKRLAAAAGLPIAPYLAVTKEGYGADPAAWAARARDALRLPVFVKPCNMGSSVGVHKVKAWEGLDAALRDAFRYDLKVLIEQGIDAREIEVAVLEGEGPGAPPLTSLASELNAAPQHEFYSYAAKYLDADGASVDLPARLEPAEMAAVRDLAARAFAVLECSGMARVDFFLDRATGGFVFNEINTLPGFTSISMYPKMMEASGVPYATLLTRLIDLAHARHARHHALAREFEA